MKHGRFLLQVACCLLLASSASSASSDISAPAAVQTDTQCVFPDPHELLGDIVGLERVDYSYFVGQPLRWLFISSGAPPTGEVFVLACDGRVLAKRELGYVEKFGNGPDAGGAHTIEVVYISAWGNLVAHSVALLTFDGKSISTVWDHESDSTAAIPADTRSGWETGTEHYDWVYSTSGGIEVTGTSSLKIGRRTRTHALPREEYCYRSAFKKFVRCQ